jgi:S1-C subfamily serine protease
MRLRGFCKRSTVEIVISLLCICLLIPTSGEAGDNLIPGAIQEIKASIGKVTVTFTNLPADSFAAIQAYLRNHHEVTPQNRQTYSASSGGTCFAVFIGSDHNVYALTAAHVVNLRLPQTGNDLAFGNRDIEVTVPVPNVIPPFVFIAFDVREKAELVAEDKAHDIALLKFHEPDNALAVNGQSGVKMKPLRPAQNRPQDGEVIIISGYPLSVASLITTSGIMSAAWELTPQAIQQGGFPTGGSYSGDVYVVDAIANPGASGGPVYSVDTKRVVGICDGVFPSLGGGATGLGGAYTAVIPIEYAIPLLKSKVSGWKE